MSPIQAFILGIIQGITEFLPVSSSAHLVITPYLFSWNFPPEDAFVFDVLVQVATLVAVFAVFWKDLWQILRGFFVGLWQRKPFSSPDAKMGWYLILATVPASLIGIGFKGIFEEMFSNPVATSFCLLITSVLLIVAERVGTRTKSISKLNWIDVLVMGLFQALALFPGISRSGATITGGMIRNLERPDAAKFSFLMSVPVMLAAGLVATNDLLASPYLRTNISIYAWGFLSAAVVGYLSIRWLLRYLVNHPLYVFSLYTAAFAVLTILVYAFRSN